VPRYFAHTRGAKLDVVERQRPLPDELLEEEAALDMHLDAELHAPLPHPEVEPVVPFPHVEAEPAARGDRVEDSREASLDGVGTGREQHVDVRTLWHPLARLGRAADLVALEQDDFPEVWGEGTRRQ
jgi:hypothetical protein